MLDRIPRRFAKIISVKYPTKYQLIIDYRPMMSIIAAPISITIFALGLAIYCFNTFNGTIINRIVISLIALAMGLSFNVPVFILVPWQIICLFDLEQDRLIITKKVFDSQNTKQYILGDIKAAKIEKFQEHPNSYDAEADNESAVVEKYRIILYEASGNKINLFGSSSRFLSGERRDYERILQHICSFLILSFE